jgi:hypothetical protein
VAALPYFVALLIMALVNVIIDSVPIRGDSNGPLKSWASRYTGTDVDLTVPDATNALLAWNNFDRMFWPVSCTGPGGVAGSSFWGYCQPVRPLPYGNEVQLQDVASGLCVAINHNKALGQAMLAECTGGADSDRSFFERPLVGGTSVGFITMGATTGATASDKNWLCLDISPNSSSGYANSGNSAIGYACTSSKANQQFQPTSNGDGTYMISSGATPTHSFCLAPKDDGSAFYTPVIAGACNHRWRMIPVGPAGATSVIANYAAGICLTDLVAGSVTSLVLPSGCGDPAGMPTMQLQMVQVGQSTFLVRDSATQHCLDTPVQHPAVGAAAAMEPCTGIATQTWAVAPTQGGSMLVQSSTGMALDINAAGAIVVDPVNPTVTTEQWMTPPLP